MNEESTARCTVDVKALEAKQAQARALYAQACRRHRELVELSRETRRRREQIRGERELVRAQMAMRRSSAPDADGRAAAAILEAAVQVMRLSVEELWLDYFALGGDAGPARVRKLLAGEAPLSRADHDRLAVALNERLSQRGWGRPLAYWDGSR